MYWARVVSSNPWLFAFFLYFGLSVIWSDYPLPSFKKWTKDLGNIIMILVILTESEPLYAIRALFARYIYFAVPLSVVLIIFFPEISTEYVKDMGMLTYAGVTTHKNELGHILAISTLFLTWDLIDKRFAERTKSDIFVRFMLLAMVMWLSVMAKSATGMLCMLLGVVVLLAIRVPVSERLVRRLGTYSLVIGTLIFVLATFPEVTNLFFKVVGRETTFTGRTDIWTGLLGERVNPLFGAGFQSFWLQPGVMERYGNISEAHNGYLETYLNGGLIGLSLLLTVLVSAWTRLKRELLAGASYAPLLFSFFAITIVYNLTESVFDRLDLTWFVFLIAYLGSMPLLHAEPEQEAEGAVFLNAGEVRD